MVSQAHFSASKFLLLVFCLSGAIIGTAQNPMPDTARIGAFLQALQLANKDTLEMTAYKKSKNSGSQQALDTATLYRDWMPNRYGDALEIRAVFMYYKEGQREKADSMFNALIEWRRKYQPQELPYAVALYQKSRVYLAKQEYAKSDSLIQVTLQMFRDKGEVHTLRYAKILNGYGQLLTNTRRVPEAEKAFETSFSILQELGNMREYAVQLSDLAESRSQRGKYEVAENGFLRARVILDSIGHTNQPYKPEPMYFGAGINLAKLYANQKKLEKALSLYEEIRRDCPDTLSNLYLAALNGIAGVSFERGDFAKAREYYTWSLRSSRKLYPANHPSLRRAEFRLAKLNYADKRPADALPVFTNLLPKYDEALLKASEYFSETEILSYQRAFIEEFSVCASFGWDYPSPTMSKVLYNHVLATKTAILDNNLRLRAAVKRSGADAQLQWKKWTDLKKKVSDAINANQPVGELEEQISLLEKQMTVFKTAKNDQRQAVTWEDVRAALKPGEVAVEFIQFIYRNPYEHDSLAYAALVLRPEYDAPAWVPLCEKRQLDALFADLVDTVPRTYTVFYNGSVARQTLDNLIWTNKLSTYIKPNETILYALDGDLYRVNLGAIAVGKSGKRLMDAGKWLDVGSTRELVLNRTRSSDIPTYPQATDNALIYGGIDYGVVQDSAQGNRIHDTREWQFLYGTQEEATHLDSLCRALHITTELIMGPSATEKSLKEAGMGKEHYSPWLLHLGTHGFYYPQQKKASPDQPFFQMAVDPMWRTGLKMANAYRQWYQPAMDPKGKKEEEDGVLFAYEVAQLDLSRTYLSVLSACETGRGENRGFEGLFGLRRAFRVAGSKYLIITLWNADDGATAEFMRTFYTQLLAQRTSIQDAFSKAQKKLMAIGRYSEPYYWANFVLVGPGK